MGAEIWRRGILGAGVAALLVAAVLLRATELADVPGMNGDEARIGCQVLSLRSGVPTGLRTSSGLVPNFLYMGPLYLLHALSPEPRFWKLRIIALASGLVTLGLTYPLVARIWDRRTALLATLLVAASPPLIIYSRLGYDPSQIPLVGLATIYFALRGEWWGALAVLSMGLAVHPTNVFLAPAVAAVWLCAPPGAEAARRGPPAAPLGWRLGLLGGATLLLGAALWAVVETSPVGRFIPGGLDGVRHRLTDPSQMATFVFAVADLLSGTTVYAHVAGRPSLEFIVAARLVAGALAVGLLAVGIRRRDRQGLALAVGLGIGLVALYLVGGTAALSPGWERYGLFSVVPMLLLAARFLRALGNTSWAWTGQLIGTLSIGASLLLGCHHFYHATLHATGSDAFLLAPLSRSFRTGPIDPKQAAFERITAEVPGDAEIAILAEDWWTYFPIRYLAYGRPLTHVLFTEEAGDFRPQGRRLFAVGFAEGPSDRLLGTAWGSGWMADFFDYQGRPVVRLWELTGREAVLPELARVCRRPGT
ncbi:MAG: glycosyltransferase family 39 protein [Gemmataceae bacterium]|nr:glycosyltransferase family 39 protein [Gemmataceae bacterium]MDW8267318.1 glycosyltransferase family 39 protein [Gemmataceae bacterium]